MNTNFNDRVEKLRHKLGYNDFIAHIFSPEFRCCTIEEQVDALYENEFDVVYKPDPMDLAKAKKDDDIMDKDKRAGC